MEDKFSSSLAGIMSMRIIACYCIIEDDLSPNCEFFMPIVSLDTWRNSTIWQDDTEEARVHSQGKVQGMAVDEKTVEG